MLWAVTYYSYAMHISIYLSLSLSLYLYIYIYICTIICYSCTTRREVSGWWRRSRAPRRRTWGPIYIYDMCMYVCVYIYIYIYSERERYREREIIMCIHIYIYIQIVIVYHICNSICTMNNVMICRIVWLEMPTLSLSLTLILWIILRMNG